jgi:PncC family amidohydrolase
VKHSVLGIDDRLLEHVVSEEVAVGMAIAAAKVLAADVGVGTTGVAGPEWLDGQPPGTVWIACHDARAGRSRARKLSLPGGRQEIRRGSVDACLAEIEALVRGGWRCRVSPTPARNAGISSG